MWYQVKYKNGYEIVTAVKSPHGMVTDSNGKVVYRGIFEHCEYWLKFRGVLPMYARENVNVNTR